MIGGNRYPARSRKSRIWRLTPRPATVAGVRMLAAGRLGSGLLIVREEAAIAAPVAAPDMMWDNRFLLIIRWG